VCPTRTPATIASNRGDPLTPQRRPQREQDRLAGLPLWPARTVHLPITVTNNGPEHGPERSVPLMPTHATNTTFCRFTSRRGGRQCATIPFGRHGPGHRNQIRRFRSAGSGGLSRSCFTSARPSRQAHHHQHALILSGTTPVEPERGRTTSVSATTSSASQADLRVSPRASFRGRCRAKL